MLIDKVCLIESRVKPLWLSPPDLFVDLSKLLIAQFSNFP